ncbi:MAG TPA: hypothetical protein VEP94_09170, partial [Solirubrobacterales bacterium]|nr:hypothetical protein [Solirubrobacterales bacterium]
TTARSSAISRASLSEGRATRTGSHGVMQRGRLRATTLRGAENSEVLWLAFVAVAVILSPIAADTG